MGSKGTALRSVWQGRQLLLEHRDGELLQDAETRGGVSCEYETFADVVAKLAFCIGWVYNAKGIHSLLFIAYLMALRTTDLSITKGGIPPDYPNSTCPIIGVRSSVIVIY